MLTFKLAVSSRIIAQEVPSTVAKKTQRVAFLATAILLFQAALTCSDLIGRENAGLAHAKGKRHAPAPSGNQANDDACTPGYDPCIPPGPDVDCAGGSGNGPRYVEGPVRVTGNDPYGLDRDGDGIGCER
jgi:hypothetical protein